MEVVEQSTWWTLCIHDLDRSQCGLETWRSKGSHPRASLAGCTGTQEASVPKLSLPVNSLTQLKWDAKRRITIFHRGRSATSSRSRRHDGAIRLLAASPSAMQPGAPLASVQGWRVQAMGMLAKSDLAN